VYILSAGEVVNIPGVFIIIEAEVVYQMWVMAAIIIQYFFLFYNPSSTVCNVCSACAKVSVPVERGEFVCAISLSLASNSFLGRSSILLKIAGGI